MESKQLTRKVEEFAEDGFVQLIIFKLGKEEYGVPINCIQEIIVKQEATKMPQTPPFVEGVINLRGKIIPIIDGKKKFNLSDDEALETSEKIMVVDLSNDVIGLVVDDVYEVVQVPLNEIEEPPVEVNSETNFLMGVAKFEGRLLILLNPEEVLSNTEASALKGLSGISSMINEVETVKIKK